MTDSRTRPRQPGKRLDRLEELADRLEKMLDELTRRVLTAPTDESHEAAAEYEIRCQRLVVVDDEGRERLVAQSGEPGRFTLEMATSDGAARIVCRTNDDPEGGYVSIGASSKRGDAHLCADGSPRVDDDDWMAAHLAIEQVNPRAMTTISSNGVEIVEDMDRRCFSLGDGELRLRNRSGRGGVLLSTGSEPSMHLLNDDDAIDVTIDQTGVTWGLA